MGDEAKALLGRLAAGEESAFAELYDRYGAGLLAAAMRMLARRQDAEDAVQEVFAALVRSRRRLILVEDLAAYLFVSLRRSAGRVAERRPRMAELDVTAAGDPESAVNSRAEAVEAHERLHRAIRRLPAEQREVIALRLNGELTFEQIGRVLGISPNTAASRYRYAIRKLRDALRDE